MVDLDLVCGRPKPRVDGSRGNILNPEPSETSTKILKMVEIFCSFAASQNCCTVASMDEVL
jgi:hypothetical protein